MIKCQRPPPPSRHFSFFLMSFSSSPDHNWFSSTATYWCSPVFIFVFFFLFFSFFKCMRPHWDRFSPGGLWGGWSETMRDGARKEERKKKESMWKRQKAAFIRKNNKKDINNQKTEIFMEKKKIFLGEKVAKWFSFCMSPFFFFLFFVFFSSSFEVNLNVHRRNWRAVSLLAPAWGRGRGQGGGARSGPRQSLWDIRLLPNSFESKKKQTVWSILDCGSSPVVFTFFRQCKVFW